MGSAQYNVHNKPDTAITQSIHRLEKNRQFADAYQLAKTHLERNSGTESVLAGFIRNAHEAGLLDDCAAFLVGLADSRPEDAGFLNYTAGLLGGMGRARESRDVARRAAALRPFFPSSVKNARLTVLALQCIATGDYRYSPVSARFYLPGITNLYTLLDPKIAVHRLLVDDLPAAMDAVRDAPKCDIVFNTISDPDYEEALANAATLCDALGLPVFNPPREVRRLNRTSLPCVVHKTSTRLTAARSVFLPPERAEDEDIAAAMRDNHFDYPVIVRASGFQGGQHMTRLTDDGGSIGQDLYRGNGLYVIEFIDVSFADPSGCRFYPKYRAFYANNELFPMHLLVSDQYEVHKKTSDPVRARHPWLLDMETDFVRDPARHLPPGLWQELKAAIASVGLDYCGVDFAVSARAEDCGKLVLFECNAAMANRIGVLPDGGPIQRQWHSLTEAAHLALCLKSGVPAWPFALKKGLLFSLGNRGPL